MKHIRLIIPFILLIFLTVPLFSSESSASSSGGKVFFKGQKVKTDRFGDYDRLTVDGKEISGKSFTIDKTGKIAVNVLKKGTESTQIINAINGWLTLLPPIIAILLALLFKEVVISLFFGIFIGSFLVNDFNLFSAFFKVVDQYVLEALADQSRASIIVFTLFLGGMVGIITKSGGIKGVVEKLSQRVKSPTGIQRYSWLMGILIFFDDYTNTLVVGNTMRPLSDRWKISREKLAYIVDSTAAPIASVALISTWIGFEISLINQSLQNYGYSGADGYSLFLSSLPFRFYPILALFFVFMVFTLKKDFGPMLKAERRARAGKVLSDKAVPLSDFESSGLNPKESVKVRWTNGLIPILIVIATTFIGLYISGISKLKAAGDAIAELSFTDIVFSANIMKHLGEIVSKADSAQVLIWASLLGIISAALLAGTRKILNLKEIVSALIQGMKSMMMAIVILVLAWSLGVVLIQLNTADFLVSLLSQSLDYHIFPAIVFIFSGLIAFSTGTSWGTIAIMYPLVIPVTLKVLDGQPPATLDQFLILVIASVLAGAVFGDHCSPISDTTIMSSMASSCDHIDHVKTQFPYAVTVSVLALFVGIIPVSYGFPYLISILSAAGLGFLILFYFGKNPDQGEIKPNIKVN